MKRNLTAIGLFVALCLTTNASARRPDIVLEGGFYTLDKLCYIKKGGAPKYKFADIVEWSGGAIDRHDETITYDGDSTLVAEIHSRVVVSDDLELGRLYVGGIDPAMGDELELRRAVLRRKGKPDESYGQADLREESLDQGFDYYSSFRLYYLELPVDEAAGTLNIEVVVTTHSHPGFEGYVSRIDPLQTMGYTDTRTLTYRYPVDRPLYFKQRGFTMEPRVVRDGEMEEIRYELHHLRPQAHERWAAHPLSNYPVVLASSLPDWTGFHGLAAQVFGENSVADDAIREQVARLTEGLTDPRARAKAIYHFVAADLHYLGVFLGESGWVPHPAPEVFARRYGDCKDHTVLLVAMLREAGIPAWPALVHMGIPAFVDPDLPTLLANHAVVYAEIDGEGLFLDGTSNPFQFGNPSDALRHRTAVVLGDDAVRLIDVPTGSAGGSWEREEIELQLEPDGTLRAGVTLSYDGFRAAWLRDRLRKETAAEVEREDVALACGAYTLPQELIWTYEEDAGVGPVVRRASLSSADHVRRAGPVMILALPWLELPSAIEPKPSAHDFEVFVRPLSYQANLTLRLPPGFRVINPPEDLDRTWPGGKLLVDVTVDGSVLTIEGSASWDRQRVAPAAAESYAQFRTALHDALQQTLVLEEVAR
jgi:transglutaminase-like putative cysteine protease